MVPKICKPSASAKYLAGVLMGILAGGAVACKKTPREGDEALVGGGQWGGLEVQVISPPGAPAKGGPVLVLLHGFGGAPGIGSFRRGPRVAAVRQQMRVFMPAGLEEYRGGRAWWGGDGAYWPAHAEGEEQGAVLGTDPPVARARAAVQALLKDIRREFQPSTLALAGYSQGGMLAMDVALTRDPPVDRVAILSAALLASSLPGLRADGADPPVFVTHGRNDRLVPFGAGERLKQLLERHGHRVLWRPFDGGHQLPPREIFDQLVPFLGGAALLQQ